tara:strand:+ start:1271 stop:2368 length:1098 start_codon:yes stop_codon:yes gene_type:complete
LKVSIGSKVVEGPYGGGNLFVKNLSSYLLKKGNSVVYDLKDKDIDIILIINPLKNSESGTFNHLDALFYTKFVNKKSIIVQRINECDERKNTNNVNTQIIQANKFADYTVYVSQWISDLFNEKGLDNKDSKVILSGSDIEIFNQKEKAYWNGKSKFKLATHHWSANWMKGFDSYKIIDDLLDDSIWAEKISFTYIGNLPNNYKFRNAEVVEPLSDIDLAKKLKLFDGYITGSINEPSGNHHIEAMQCGLPILFINSGGIPEYCSGNGLVFNNDNLEEKLEIFIKNYSDYINEVRNYSNNSDRMSKEFHELFTHLLSEKEKFISKRVEKNKVILLFIYNISKLRKTSFFYFIKFKKFLSKNFRKQK